MEENINLSVVDLNGIEHKISAPVDMGLNLMEAIRANNLQIKATCGGMALCATCHVIVNSDHQLPQMSENEEEMLDQAMLLDIPNGRLSCQIHLTTQLNDLKVSLGESTGE